MLSSPYVRPAVAVLYDEAPDATAVVNLRLGRLKAARAAASDARAAYDRLAAWAGLQRFRPELLSGGAEAAEWAEADRAVRAVGRDLAGLALRVPNPDAWLSEAQAFADDANPAPDPADLAVQAFRLLTDLDDADLVVFAARRFGIPDEKMEEDLARCAAWIEENSGAFLDAGGAVQSVGLALRPDLPSHDPELAWTADKFVLVLDAAEDAAADLTFADPPVLPAPRLRRQRLPPLLRPTHAAAAETPQVEPPPYMIRWASPDGTLTADLILPGASSLERDGDTMLLRFYAGKNQAAGLAGRTARLAGVHAVIDASGATSFRLGDLRSGEAACDALSLCVEPDPREWTLSENPS